MSRAAATVKPQPSHRARVAHAVRPLLKRHPDLVLRPPRLLLVTPVRHFLRTITIDSRAGRTGFGVYFGCVPLYTDIVTVIGGGLKVGRPAHTRDFDWADDDAVGDLRFLIDTTLLPALRAIDRPERYLSHRMCVPRVTGRYRREVSPVTALTNRIAFVGHELAEGRLDRVRDTLERVPPDDRPRTPLWDALSAGDMAAAVAALHALERQNVTRLGLLDVWEQTPFPCEPAVA